MIRSNSNSRRSLRSNSSSHGKQERLLITELPRTSSESPQPSKPLDNSPLSNSVTRSTSSISSLATKYGVTPARAHAAVGLCNTPSFVEHEGLRFLIFDAPTDENLFAYVEELNRLNIKKVVRTCEPTYNGDSLKPQGIEVIDVTYPDGRVPNDDVIDRWLRIVVKENSEQGRPVAVHCVAGLGRAPVLVALALMELVNMTPLDAIEKIRNVRRGSFNQKQFNFLLHYKVKNKADCCVVL